MWRRLLLLLLASILLFFSYGFPPTSAEEVEGNYTASINASYVVLYGSTISRLYNASLEPSVLVESFLGSPRAEEHTIAPSSTASTAIGKEKTSTALLDPRPEVKEICIYTKTYHLLVRLKPNSYGGSPLLVAVYVGGWRASSGTNTGGDGYIEGAITLESGSYHITRLGLGHSSAGYSDPTYYSVQLVEETNGTARPIETVCNGTATTHSWVSNCCGAPYLDYISVDCSVTIPEPECTTVYPPPPPPQPHPTWTWTWTWTWSPPAINVSINNSIPIPEIPSIGFVSPSLSSPAGIIASALLFSIWAILALTLGIGNGSIVAGLVITLYGYLIRNPYLVMGGLGGIAAAALYSYIKQHS